MDAPRETRASRILAPKSPTIEFKERNTATDAERDGELGYAAWPAGSSIMTSAPSISGILSNLREELEVKAAIEP
jgi:hypothetical protein